MNKDPYAICVTIGHPKSMFTDMNRVTIFVDHDKGQTPIQAAKLLRKKVADNPQGYGWVEGTRFRPADLYYKIYVNADQANPYAQSTNAPD